MAIPSQAGVRMAPYSYGNSIPPLTSDATEPISEVTEPTKRREDVNGDNIVNIQDLVLVASNLGQSGSNSCGCQP